ncbi:MAG: helix-turn-helix transcriptional regulator [Clostridia bacterium]|nr:helix-turn-helix transcriptional regulator [Clostridia bacterium]
MNTIQEMRAKVNLTQEEVARELNIDRSTVAKWETGKADPRAEMLVKLSKLFGCSIDELMTADVT